MFYVNLYLTISEKSKILIQSSWYIQAILSIYQLFILTKIHKDQQKNVNFFAIAKFWAVIIFFYFLKHYWECKWCH